MSSIAKRTRKQTNDRLLEMYQEQRKRKRKEEGSSRSKDGEAPALSQGIDDSEEKIYIDLSDLETDNSDDDDLSIHEDSYGAPSTEMEHNSKEEFVGVIEIDSDDNKEDDDERKGHGRVYGKVMEGKGQEVKDSQRSAQASKIAPSTEMEHNSKKEFVAADIRIFAALKLPPPNEGQI